MADPQKVKVFDGTNWVDIQPDASAMTLCQVSDVECADAYFRGAGQVLEYKYVPAAGGSQFVIVDLFDIKAGGLDKCESGRRHVSVSIAKSWRLFVA